MTGERKNERIIHTTYSSDCVTDEQKQDADKRFNDAIDRGDSVTHKNWSSFSKDEPVYKIDENAPSGFLYLNSAEMVANNHPCLHEQCPECNGTGQKKDGSSCFHMISCPCPKCSPWS